MTIFYDNNLLPCVIQFFLSLNLLQFFGVYWPELQICLFRREKRKTHSEIESIPVTNFTFFKVHLNTVHKPRPFTCSACSRTFDTQNAHKLHFESIHERKNVEKCPHCKKNFRRLQEHIFNCTTDISKRRKKCECGKSFTRELDLRKHYCTLYPLVVEPETKKNLGLKKKKRERFQCTDCGKHFLNKTLINRHIRKICKSATFSVLQRSQKGKKI